MSKESDYNEYESITHLLKSEEWWSWKNFLEDRIEMLSKKVVRLVREKQYIDANGVTAVIYDIQKQLDAFRSRKGTLEDRLLTKS